MQIRDDDLLLVIDVQTDFCPGGALAVADGDAVVPIINRLTERFNHVALTQDWHPSGHSSFATSHPGSAPFQTIRMPYGEQTLWPDHCIQGAPGAAFHPQLVTERAELVIRKGFRPEIDSYSASAVCSGSSWPGSRPTIACITPLWTRAGLASTPCSSRLAAGPSIWPARSMPPGPGWRRPACSASTISASAYSAKAGPRSGACLYPVGW
jgi:hypothetical protein